MKPVYLAAFLLATAFFVMGLDKTREFCHGRDDLAAVMVCPGERSGAIELHPIGLEESDWDRLV